MSIFVSSKAIELENKKYKRSKLVMKKTRLPTQLKSKKCSLQEHKKYCTPALHKVKDFILCDHHFQMWERKNIKFKPSYIKGSSL